QPPCTTSSGGPLPISLTYRLHPPSTGRYHSSHSPAAAATRRGDTAPAEWRPLESASHAAHAAAAASTTKPRVAWVTISLRRVGEPADIGEANPSVNDSPVHGCCVIGPSFGADLLMACDAQTRHLAHPARVPRARVATVRRAAHRDLRKRGQRLRRENDRLRNLTIEDDRARHGDRAGLALLRSGLRRRGQAHEHECTRNQPPRPPSPIFPDHGDHPFSECSWSSYTCSVRRAPHCSTSASRPTTTPASRYSAAAASSPATVSSLTERYPHARANATASRSSERPRPRPRAAGCTRNQRSCATVGSRRTIAMQPMRSLSASAIQTRSAVGSKDCANRAMPPATYASNV